MNSRQSQHKESVRIQQEWWMNIFLPIVPVLSLSNHELSMKKIQWHSYIYSSKEQPGPK